MKSMKLYSDVHRIYNTLSALGIGPQDPLTVAQLSAHDQYHYDGTHAVDLALVQLQVGPGLAVLDIGSGIGGPARHVAVRTGARVTALELQADLDAVARDLTARCGLAGQVTHVCGNILDGSPDLDARLGGPFDAILSMLCMLHIPDKPRLFAACRAALKPGRAMYIEDFALRRPLTASEAQTLAVKVQSADLPTPDAYRAHLERAGFADVALTDVTADWRAYSAARVLAARSGRAASVAVHGAEVVAGLEDFYEAVDGLWQGGALTGLRIVAR